MMSAVHDLVVIKMHLGALGANVFYDCGRRGEEVDFHIMPFMCAFAMIFSSVSSIASISAPGKACSIFS